MRQDYINRFLNQYAPEVKVIKKVEPKKVVATDSKKVEEKKDVKK